MKIKSYPVYGFNELSSKAKDKAIDEWYSKESYDSLSSDLTESLKCLLDMSKFIKSYSGVRPYYSLSWSQGDGLCFVGSFQCFKQIKLAYVTHRARYCYCGSENIEFDEDSNWTEKQKEKFKGRYKEICKDLEREGYDALEYRMTYDEFAELCSSNSYTFTSEGKMDNI